MTYSTRKCSNHTIQRMAFKGTIALSEVKKMWSCIKIRWSSPLKPEPDTKKASFKRHNKGG